jgi:hypothetical protein
MTTACVRAEYLLDIFLVIVVLLEIFLKSEVLARYFGGIYATPHQISNGPPIMVFYVI